MYKLCNCKCENESDVDRLSAQGRELGEWRDKCDWTFIDNVQCQTSTEFTFFVLIEFLKTVCFCFKVPHYMCE